MAFLLEGETDETLAAALAFLDEQQKSLTPSLQEPLELSDDSPASPAADILDDLSPELPAPADKAIKNISWTAAIPTPSSSLNVSSRAVSQDPKSYPEEEEEEEPYVRKKPLSYNPNKARDERKLELIYLRQKKLQEIKEANRANADASESVTALAANHDSHSTNVGAPSLGENSTEDTMVESFGMDMYDAKSNTKAEFNVKQILRRYVEEDRVVVVWRSHIMPLEFSNKRFAPRAHSDDSSDDDDFTLVQTCYIITPDLSDQSLNDDAKTGALTEFVLSSTASNISASHEMIENVLLDQALRQRKRRE
ncbi:hypothetical protein GQ600_4941 [Phytophthora cactorum]|nr:hypothetical protein GQ600_4941 [Phytophthora cactorum]